MNASKPERCPECGSRQIVRILYGLPASDVEDEARRGELIIGGCMIGPDSPEWGCGACGWEPRPNDSVLLGPDAPDA